MEIGYGDIPWNEIDQMVGYTVSEELKLQEVQETAS
jgi:hypothetical protein